jgi:hypothetical protein
MLKQLNVTGMDWQKVADELGLKNPAAASLRWWRFKEVQLNMGVIWPGVMTKAHGVPKPRQKKKVGRI